MGLDVAAETAVATDAPLVGLAEIRAAAATLDGVALRTPLLAFGPSERHEFLKAESLQPIGAFKIRGAYVAIAGLEPADPGARRDHLFERQPRPGRRPGGAPASGCRRSSSCPPMRRAIKRDRVAADGAEVVIVGPSSEERRLAAERIAAERGLSIIPPFDDDRIIAGQGTCGLEIAEDLPDLAAVLVPIGGGGLAAGVATAVKALRPAARVIGVEPELAADARDSFRAGRIVAWPADQVGRTIADGTRTQAIGRRNLAHLRAYLDDIVTVSEDEIVAAVRLAAEECRLIVEPSGALSIAGLRFRAAEAGLVGLDGLARRRGQRRQRRSGALPRAAGGGPAG